MCDSSDCTHWEKYLTLTAHRYSANLSHSIDQRVIVASGTVFNQVLLWKLNDDHDPHTSRVKVNLTLTGHDVCDLTYVCV